MAAKVTDLRRELLQAVADGEITYQPIASVEHRGATWFRGGEPLGGWHGRTLRALRHDESPLIMTPDTSTPGARVVVQLTAAGRVALNRAAGHADA